jgi:hypothetical protein
MSDARLAVRPGDGSSERPAQATVYATKIADGHIYLAL